MHDLVEKINCISICLWQMAKLKRKVRVLDLKHRDCNFQIMPKRFLSKNEVEEVEYRKERHLLVEDYNHYCKAYKKIMGEKKC